MLTRGAAWLRARYQNKAERFANRSGSAVPKMYASNFVSLGRGGAEIQQIHRRMLAHLKPGARVLVIGADGGRDYFLARSLGLDVVALDLGPQPELPVTIGDAQQGLPFPSETFDAVIACEVLEHLIYDAIALGHIRRVLKHDGTLLLSVPFVQDEEPAHVRVHTQKSILRLLGATGFACDAYVERPGLPGLPALGSALAAVVALMPGDGTGLLDVATRAAGSASYALGASPSLAWYRKRSRAHGAHLTARKSDDALDVVALNRATYTEAPRA
jgi:SAM-dependent methyltransferase